MFELVEPSVTCGTEEEGDDWYDGHVAEGGHKGERDDGEGDAPVLYGGLQRYGNNLTGRL